MHNYEDDEMQLVFEESLYGLQPSFSRCRSWSPACGRRRKVGFEQIFPLLWRKKGIFALIMLAIYLDFSGSDHLEIRDRSEKGE